MRLPWIEPLERRLLLDATAELAATLPEAKSNPPVLALIDSTLPDQSLLIQSVGNAQKIFFDPRTESATSVLERTIQVANQLGGGVGTVIVLSHGVAGEFELGDNVISSESLATTAPLWEALGKDLAPGAAIDLFACDLAADPQGLGLLNQLHALTGAGVFGSTNITGKDGDWILEAHSCGTDDLAPPINTVLLASYPADLLGLVTIQTAAAANPTTVTGKTTNLSVLAADTGGESNVTYTWLAVTLSTAPTYSANGTNAAKNTTATFSQSGVYVFTVTAQDGLSLATSSVTVTVDQTLTTVTVSPNTASLNFNGEQLFTATGYDQFGNAITLGPTFTWSVDSGGVGSVNALGLYSAGTTAGSAIVRATSGAVSGTSDVTVTDAAPSVTVPASAVPNPVTTTTSVLAVVATDLGGLGNLTYTWSAITKPAGANPSFSLNGSALSDTTTVTFNEAGDYLLQVAISDGEATTDSSVNVTVEQTLTSVTVSPSTANLGYNETEQFTASALDQFGNSMTTQPTFTWSIDPLGVGSVSTSGLYTSPATSGNATVRATADTLYSGTASVTVGDTPPTVIIPATATPNPVTATTTVLAVVAADLGGLGTLTYTWSATSEPADANPSFSLNGSSLSNTTTVTFDEAGDYIFQVAITDGSATTYSSVDVTVEQTLTSVTVSPSTANLGYNETQQFTAAALDQFGNAMASQPTFTWSIDPLGVGSVSTSGLYTSADTAGNATVRATADTLYSGTASVTVGDTPPTVIVPATATPNPVTGTTTVLTVVATDLGGLGTLTYTWSATSEPVDADPSFSLNGSALSDISTVTFDEAGDYTFQVAITDGSATTYSSVNVTVEQTLTSVTVSPSTANMGYNETQQFAATALDQFGDSMATQPTFTWSIDPLGVGSVSTSGLYTSSTTSGTATVRATADTLYSGTASVTVGDTPPTIIVPATATPNPVTGTTTLLSVVAADLGGLGTLTYTWSATSEPADANPSFSLNGSSLSNITTVTFNEAGDYTFQVAITDGSATTYSSVNVTVEQTLTSVTVSPSTAELGYNETQQFTATALDQFGNSMTTQPTFTWSIDPLGVGSVSTSGLYTSPATSGTATLRATADTLYSGTASVTVGDTPPTVIIPATATPNPVTGTSTVLTVVAADLGGLGTLTYTWSATSEPVDANPSFSLNGSSLSNITTVTFNEAGNYTFQVAITDGSATTFSSVNVTVEQTLTSVTVSPSTAELGYNETQQFTATALDQFNNAMATQPTFTWSIDPLGVGSVSTSGLYTSPVTSGTATVRATADTLYSGTASVTVGDTPPTVIVPATATPNPVTGTSTVLAVVAADLGGLGTLTYTWSATSEPADANPSFSLNGSGLSNITTVTFNEGGDYTFQVAITDGSATTYSSVNVTVEQTLTTVTVSPTTADLGYNETQLFAASALDQFGNAMATPPTFTWSIDPLGVGSVSTSGLYTSSTTSGNATVRATADLLYSGTASVTVGDTPPTVILPATATPNPVTGTSTLLTVVAADLGGLGILTYTWSATSQPTGADPTFSVNGDGLSDITTVTFNEAGDYTFQVAISDGNATTYSSVNVTVEQTLTTVNVTPGSANLGIRQTQQFAATALDQFGAPMATQPGFTWSIDPLGVGSVNSSGLYTAPDSTGTADVRATADSLYSALGSVAVTDSPPTVLVAATAAPNPVTGTTTVLSVVAIDLNSLLNLTYTWSATSAPAGADPTFSLNGSGLSDITTATFNEAGDYTFQVAISDGTVTTFSSVNVTVEQTLTTVTVSPTTASVGYGQTEQFAATGLDQFGNQMATEPGFTWSIDPLGVGSVSTSGLYTAPNSAGTATVRATADTLFSGTASVTVAGNVGPQIVTTATATPNPVTGITTSLSVTATELGAVESLTYTWSATSAPNGAKPLFSSNGTGASDVTTATFDEAGNYTFTVVVSDGTHTAQSSVNVVVDQTLTTVTVTPATSTVLVDGTEQFSAVALDQFGKPMATQPAFTWSVDVPGEGTIDQNGLYTAPADPGSAVIRATADLLHSGTGIVTITAVAPTPPTNPIIPTPPINPIVPVLPTPPTTPTTPTTPTQTVTVTVQPIVVVVDPALPTPGLPTPPAGHGGTPPVLNQANTALPVGLAAPVSTSAEPVEASQSIIAAAVAVTTGIIAQLLLPGSFVASMFSSLPAWKWVDPVSILDPSRARKTKQPGKSAEEESKLKGLLE